MRFRAHGSAIYCWVNANVFTITKSRSWKAGPSKTERVHSTDSEVLNIISTYSGFVEETRHKYQGLFKDFPAPNLMFSRTILF